VVARSRLIRLAMAAQIGDDDMEALG
jgi:hypothetical protein